MYRYVCVCVCVCRGISVQGEELDRRAAPVVGAERGKSVNTTAGSERITERSTHLRGLEL